MLDNLINNTGKEDILNAQYINQDIYLIYSNKGNNPEYSYDKIKEIKDFLIKDYCPGEYIHSGFQTPDYAKLYRNVAWRRILSSYDSGNRIPSSK